MKKRFVIISIDDGERAIVIKEDCQTAKGNDRIMKEISSLLMNGKPFSVDFGEKEE